MMLSEDERSADDVLAELEYFNGEEEYNDRRDN